MINGALTVSLNDNPEINVNAIPGHFATSHYHITHYIDLENLKTNALLSREVARELALPYIANTLVDTILCMERTEVIGAYLAEELIQEGTSIINSGGDIYILTPMSNIDGKLMFQSNMQKLIYNRNIIVLVSSVSSGKTLDSALECLSYYGGNVVGISALFNACSKKHEHEIHSLFTREDIPGYQIYSPSECPICKEGHKLDAIVVQDGYMKV